MSSSGTGVQWLDLIIAGALICASALFSGLTLGLMSLDLSALSVLAEAGDEREREYAKKIIPLRRNGNLLLCTLLIGNTIVNSFLSILMASITTGATGLLISTALIVLFGEIAPQAICSRHGLLIGSRTRFVTWACMGSMFILAWPISKVLDLILGREVGTMYSREELKHLIKLQVNEGAHPSGDGIDADEHNLLAGALEYSNKEVKDVMTPIEKVFMLEASTKLTFDTMLDIYKSGYTRIPVYDGTVSKDRVISVLYVKDLILVDPDDEIEVQTVVSFRGPSQVRFISDQTPLNEVFKIFKTSFSHLMIAIAFYDPDSGERLSQEDIIHRSKANDTRALSIRQVTGVITLEDILEEVIKAEIIDEHDTFVANDSMQKVHKGKGRPDMATFLSLFDHKAREHSKLSRQEVHAITAFLTARVREFALFETAPSQLRQLVQHHSTVIDVDEDSSESGDSDDSLDLLAQVREEQIDVGSKVGSHTVLYRRGQKNNTFTLVLQGRACVWAGSESFQSEIAPWSCIGNNALLHSDYAPDFTAVTNGACRLLQISRQDFEVAAATVRKAQEARLQRFSGSVREAASDRRRSRIPSDAKLWLPSPPNSSFGSGTVYRSADLASLVSQGSIVIHSPAQSREHLVMHGRSASTPSITTHTIHSPITSARQSGTNESRPSALTTVPANNRLSTSQLALMPPSGLASTPDVNGALLSSRGKNGKVPSATTDNDTSNGLQKGSKRVSRNVGSNHTGAVLAKPDAVNGSMPNAGDTGFVLGLPDKGQAGASTVAPLSTTARVSPFMPSPSSSNVHQADGSVAQDDTAMNGAEDTSRTIDIVINGADDSTGPGINAAPTSTSVKQNGLPSAGWGSPAQLNTKSKKLANGVDHSQKGAAASGVFPTVTGEAMTATSRTGEPGSRGKHDSEALRGIVMLGDRGETVCLGDSDQGDMFMEDPHNSVEEGNLRRWERQGTMKRASHENAASSPLPLAPVESGTHSALFRAMTPGETFRRQQPGWRQSNEWNSPGSGDGF